MKKTSRTLALQSVQCYEVKRETSQELSFACLSFVVLLCFAVADVALHI
jgi:hypothetical protein